MRRAGQPAMRASKNDMGTFWLRLPSRPPPPTQIRRSHRKSLNRPTCEMREGCVSRAAPLSRANATEWSNFILMI